MKIEFGTKALKFLLKLEKGNKERVLNKIKELGNDPFPLYFKKLKGERHVTTKELELSGCFID